jgi:hypothetical protein
MRGSTIFWINWRWGRNNWTGNNLKEEALHEFERKVTP